MLRRVRIRGYKSLRDVEVRFDRPLSVIIGANASGKSNLFDALALLSRMVTKPTLQEAFKEHRGTHFEAFSFDEEGIAGLFKRATAEFSIEVDLELSPRTIQATRKYFPSLQQSHSLRHKNGDEIQGDSLEHFLRYRLTVQIDTSNGNLRIIQERLAALTPHLTEQLRPVLAERNNVSISVSALGLVASGTYIGGILDNATFLSQAMFQSYYPIRALFQEINDWRFYDLQPQAMREPIGLRNVTALSANGDDLPAFFNTMQVEQPKQFESLRRALHLLIPEIEAFDVKRDSEGYLHLIVCEHGTEYSSRVISDGTLRVLGLLALTNPLEPVTLLGIEEPENGVDPHQLSLIAQLLRDTAQYRQMQLLINTHSPLLPRYFSEDELMYCWRDGTETLFEPAKKSGLWRDPTAIEA